MVGNVRALVGAGMAFVSLFLTGCGGERFSWNQKLTVVVDTPQGEVSGSSVSSVWWREGGNLNTGWTFDYEGEAAFVRLPNGKYLFALNRHDEEDVRRGRVLRSINYEWAGYVAPASIGQINGSPRIKALFAEVASKRDRAAGVINIPTYQYPLLVAFRYIDDPKSAIEVDPANLSRSLGPGYRLRSITVEITDQPRTSGKIQDVLLWLPSFKGRLDGTSMRSGDAPNQFLNSLAAGSFRTETER